MSTSLVEGFVKREWEFESLRLLNPFFRLWGKSLCLFEGIRNLDEMGKVVVVSNSHDLFPGVELLKSESAVIVELLLNSHKHKGCILILKQNEKHFLLVTVHFKLQTDDRTIFFF
jgi:hypothetical protein